jgi:hypothetical protein
MRTIQVISFVLAMAGTLGWLIWAVRHRSKWRYAIPPLSWLAHVVLYYACVLFGDLPAVMVNLWSSAVRLHAVILITSVGLFLLFDRDGRV